MPICICNPASSPCSLCLCGESLNDMRYAELHCKTNFSFLEGASHADELVRQAAALGYRALAVTDRNSLAGVVRAHIAAKDVGLAAGDRRGDHAGRCAAGRALGDRSRQLRPAVPADHPRPAAGAERGVLRSTLEDVAEFAEGLDRGSGPAAARLCRGFGDVQRRSQYRLQIQDP